MLAAFALAWAVKRLARAAARADLTTAEVAMATARDRLSILGATSRQIADLESARAPDPITTVTAPIAGMVTDREVGPGQYLLQRQAEEQRHALAVLTGHFPSESHVVPIALERLRLPPVCL